jgi:hypothetical protein
MKMKIRMMFAGCAVAAGLAMSASVARAQDAAPIAPKSADAVTDSTTYTAEQILPLTVHQAWLVSGKDEGKFFEIVTQMAVLSAKNRSLQLPESAEAGRKVGEMIKTLAKKDTDQLLYAVVDAAVRKVGTPMPASGM